MDWGYRTRLIHAALAAMAFVATGAPARAAGTPAGTDVSNSATMSYTQEGRAFDVRSNDVAFRVDEIVDVAVAGLDASGVVAAPGLPPRPLAFRVTNSGNGPEAFRLAGDGALPGDAFDPVIARLAIDADGNGLYDPAVDPDYVPGANDPLLDPDASATVFLLGEIPADVLDGGNGVAALAATAATGSGAPGALFAGQGVGGVDAVVGAGQAHSSARGAWVVTRLRPELLKSQAIADGQGGAAAVPGAVITYTLAARHAGTIAATEARVRDAIPEGTAYVAGSLKLGDQPLTDAVDGDAGHFNGSEIEVSLGTLPATPPPIRFQVKVQ